jgi:hypothetical protein
MTDAIMSTLLNTLLYKEIILEKLLQTPAVRDVSCSVFMSDYIIIGICLFCVKQYLTLYFHSIRILTKKLVYLFKIPEITISIINKLMLFTYMFT